MPTVTLRGASDDLIELDGAIVQEWPYLRPRGDDGNLIAFSDGTVLSVWFGSAGIWRIDPLVHGSAALGIVSAVEDSEDRTDIATLTGDIRWAVHGVAFAKASTSAPGADRPDLAELQRTLAAVRRMMATSSRDWSLFKGDAWLYAILVGWNDDPDEPAPPVSALANIAIRHGWSLGDMAALEAMHAAIVALDEAMS